MNILLDKEMKKMFADGLWPYSPFWAVSKINAIIKIAKQLDMNIFFSEQDQKYLKWAPFFRNYNLVIFFNNILEFKKYFKQFLTIDGHKFWIKPAPKMIEIIRDYQSLKGKNWEPETTKLVKELVKPGMTCVDIGASVGYFTLLFSRQVGTKGKVISIEPTDFQQPYRKKNVEVNGYKDRIVLIQAGAWDKDEVVRMPRNAPHDLQIELRCRPVDDILEEQGIMQVDFIKLDVDGPEPKVLKGLERTIQRSPNLQMVFEHYPKYNLDAGCNPQDSLDFLNKYFNYSVIPDDYSGDCVNFICKRK